MHTCSIPSSSPANRNGVPLSVRISMARMRACACPILLATRGLSWPPITQSGVRHRSYKRRHGFLVMSLYCSEVLCLGWQCNEFATPEALGRLQPWQHEHYVVGAFNVTADRPAVASSPVSLTKLKKPQTPTRLMRCG